MNTKTVTTLIGLFYACLYCNGQCLTDNFDEDYGNWDSIEIYRNTTAGYSGLGIGFNEENDQITTKSAINNPESILFWLGRSSSEASRTLSIQYATSPSGTWSTLGDILVEEVDEAHKAFSVPLHLTGDYYIRIIMSQRSGGSYYLDDVVIFCTPINAPELQLLDADNNYQNCGFSIDFGTIPIGETTPQTFTIQNTGSADLDISDIEIPDNFTLVSPTFPMTITAENEQHVTIKYEPTTPNSIVEALNIINTDGNESNCSITLTGNSYTPKSEIDVERNTEASIPNGSAPNIGYNTVFSSTNVGESSATKLYYIHNEGTSNLLVTSLTSSNASEFKIDPNLENTTLLPDEKVPFQITFHPATTGTRTSTISIINTDDDENPYTFQLRGNGLCPASTTTVTPTKGPIGTTVSVMGSDFGADTTVTLNELSIAPTLISSTQLELRIPENAISGNLSITNDLNCSFTTNFNVITNQTADCEGEPTFTPTDLFISEITKHASGSHSYIEIFNGTGTAIDLSNYMIKTYNNGSDSPYRTVNLTGTIAHNDVFVLAIGSSNYQDAHGSHGYDQADDITGINTNDNIRLFKEDTWIDLWGDTSGNDFTVADKGYVYQRKNDISNVPNTSWNVNDWLAFSHIDYTNIGTFNFKNGEVPSIIVQPNIISSTCELTTTCSVEAIEGFSGGSPLTYQWYYTTPENSDWQELLDNTTISGSSTSTLHILNKIDFNGYQFYCQVREPNENCHIASKAVTISVEKRVWTDAGWQNNLIPTENSITLLNSNYNTQEQGNFSTCSLIIPKDYTLTINSENFINVINHLKVEGDLIIKNKGSFVQENNMGAIENTGHISVEKETAILNAWYEYTYWSSPVSNDNFANVFKNSKRLFWFDASNFVDMYKEENNDNSQSEGQDDVDDDGNDWQPIGEAQTITKNDYLQAGTGYAATHTNTNFEGGKTYLYSFSGPLNNGVIEAPIFRNDESKADSNWNLIGNPYPSAIAVDAFFEENVFTETQTDKPLEGIIYLWSQDTPPSKFYNGNAVLNFSPSDYAIINGSGSIAAQGGSGKKPNRFIPSCQGFFVKFSDDYDSPNAAVTFNNDMRVTNENTQFFKTVSSNKVWLNLTSDNGVFSQTLVSYMTHAKDDYDGSYFDANTIISKDIPAKLYTTIPNSNYKLVIQGKASSSLTENETISLGFFTAIKSPTIFSLSIDDFEGSFFNQKDIFLKDKLLNSYHNLKQSSYAFTSEPGEFIDRFEIVFKNPSLSIKTFDRQTEISIIQINKEEVIFKLKPDAFQIETIEIIDALGRLITCFKAPKPEAAYNLARLKSKPFIAKITLSNGHVITKKGLLR